MPKRPPEPRARRWAPYALLAGTVLICALAALALSPLLQARFLTNWDDAEYVLHNPDIARLSVATVRRVFSSFYVSNYQPLTMLTYMVDRALFGLNPAGFHLTNLLLHLLNVVLVAVFVNRLTRNRFTTLVSALLFAVHPLHVESVAWISERKDLVYAAFYLAALAVYVDYVRKGLAPSSLAWALALFVLSCLSKSMAVSLPVVLFLLDGYLGRKQDRRSILEKVPFLLVAAVTGVIALHSQAQSATQVAPIFPLMQRMILVCVGLDWYVLKLLAPVNLSAIYYYPAEPGAALPAACYLAPLLPALLVFLAWRVPALRRSMFFGLGFFVVTIAPVLQIVPVGYALVADRYSYVPFLGLFLVVGDALQAFAGDRSRRRAAVYASVVLVGLGMAWLSHQRARVWQTSVLVFEDVVAHRPNAYHAYWLLGNAYRNDGQIERAVEAYDRAIRLRPDDPAIYENRGSCAFVLGRHEAALRDFDRAIALAPEDATSWYNRGTVYLKLKDYDRAIADFTRATTIDTRYAAAYFGLAEAYGTGKGAYARASEFYEHGLRYAPGSAGILYNQGLALYRLGRMGDACAAWRKAMGMGSAQAERAVMTYCGSGR